MKKRKRYLALMTAILLLAGGCAGGSEENSQMVEGAKEETTQDTWVHAETENMSDGDVMEPAEEYRQINENRTVSTDQNQMLTFSLKVDTAAYNNVERYIASGSRPPADAVRTEELINYFRYETELPETDEPFSIYAEVGVSPYDNSKHLAFVRVKGKEIAKEELPPSNLTFLIDTSGSMNSYDKLPLLKSAFQLLTDTLTEDDMVSIVTYAGSSEVVLDSVSGADKTKIMAAFEQLSASGSTAGADGILTAYQLARKNKIPDGNNRIILATDGDFNVGLSSSKELEELITEQKDDGIYLSILGFGTGNLKDDRMETLSQYGNGNYAYINTTAAAKKVLVEELGSNLYTIADDVKAQVEFNPANVASYRLIGYENRMLENKDFEDDTKDAGEIGVGTDVVVLFELELAGSDGGAGLKYQDNKASEPSSGEFADELFEVRIRYKNPGEQDSQAMVLPVRADAVKTENSSDFSFAVSVSGFCHLLRGSENSNGVTLDTVIRLAQENLGADKEGYRYGFLQMLHAYKKLIEV